MRLVGLYGKYFVFKREKEKNYFCKVTFGFIVRFFKSRILRIDGSIDRLALVCYGTVRIGIKVRSVFSYVLENLKFGMYCLCGF